MIKTTSMIATAAALAIAATATTAEAKTSRMTCAAATPAAVEGLFTKFNNAWATKNPDTVTALFARDGVLLATVSNAPRTDTAGIRDYFVGFLKNSPVGKIDSSTIRIGCNEAYRVGTWTVTLTNPETGAKTDVKARYSFIYGLENGQWKIRHLHSSMMPEKIG